MSGMIRVVSLMIVASFATTACSSLRSLGDIDRDTPDEFAIVNQPPLSMPPDFRLRPPRPGQPTPQNITPSSQAIDALFPGRTTLPPQPSDGEQALLNQIGAGQTSPDVRSTVGDDDTETVEKGEILADLLSADEREDRSDGSRIERVGSVEIDND